MRKRVFGKKLSRERATRRALFRALTRALVLHGKIKITKAKAKAVQPFIETLVKHAKGGGVVARRRVLGLMGNDREVADKLFSDVILRFKERKGGFTRMVNLPVRRGDSARVVRFEWTVELKVNEGKRNVESKGKGSMKKSVSESGESVDKGSRKSLRSLVGKVKKSVGSVKKSK